MKNKNTKRYLLIFPVVLFVLTAASCIRENMTNCEVRTRFVYDHNILSSNAFAKQVNEATLCIFDAEGVLVHRQTGESDNFTNDFYLSSFGLRPGKYTFAAWAQSTRLKSEEAYFAIPELTVGTSTIDQLTFYMRRTNGIQRHELNNLLIGTAEGEIDYKKSHFFEIPLRKINNKVRLILFQSAGGTDIDVNDYDFRIIENTGNGHINYDYSLLPDEPVTYIPYFTANVVNEGFTKSGEAMDSAAAAEINTSRLMASHDTRVIITEKNGGNTVASVNLIWLLSLIKMENHSEWSLQEYLDRQDEYSITLFFNGSTWVSSTIIINGWVINNMVIDA